MYLYVWVFFNQLKSNIFIFVSYMGYVGIFFLVFFGCVGVGFCWSGMGYFGSGYDVDGFILK